MLYVWYTVYANMTMSAVQGRSSSLRVVVFKSFLHPAFILLAGSAVDINCNTTNVIIIIKSLPSGALGAVQCRLRHPVSTQVSICQDVRFCQPSFHSLRIAHGSEQESVEFKGS